MIPALTPYISRYYDDWRRGSRRWCSFLGILPYADDVLSDVLESLCRRPEAFQLDLLAREQAGERCAQVLRSRAGQRCARKRSSMRKNTA